MTTPARAFHGYTDRVLWSGLPGTVKRSLSYTFTPHVHPFAQELLQRLVTGSVRSLQDADTDVVRNPDNTPVALPDGSRRPALYRELFTPTAYQPNRALVANPDLTVELDFTLGGAYSVYNWELFFHIPVAIAVNLSRNGRYEDAQRWFHYVFDPTDDSDGPTPDRFWKARPLQGADVESIEAILTNLSSGTDKALQDATIKAIHDWQESPFRPHLVARHRPTAYMRATVMAYLDNLIAWGDALFSQDTGESVGEATQLYVLAANLLGTRPQVVPAKGSMLPQTYTSLKNAKLDAFSNALVKLETALPFDRVPHPGPADDSDGPRKLSTLGQTLYFCVPRNDMLLGYWDTVADRLLKIHNSLTLQGVFRQLPLFDPPIDPALLARATAAGVDVAAVVAGINQPAPLVRFSVLAAKAGELCQEVKSLGAALLSAIQQQDGEALAALRATHETAVLQLAERVKYAQLQEAMKNREGLEASLAIARARYTYYERLLGRQESTITFEDVGDLDIDGLDKGQFSATEPALPARRVDIDPSAAVPGGGPAGGKKLSSYEASEMQLLSLAQLIQDGVSQLDKLGASMNIIPSFSTQFKPLGVGGTISFGGSNIAAIFSAMAASARGVAGRLTYEANRSAKIGSYARREQEWQFQSNTAAGDIAQLNKQARAAQIREYLAQRELDNHRKQIGQAEEIERFLAGQKPGGTTTAKTTTTAYYAVLRREVRGLYNQCYELAVETARKAERALRHELGGDTPTFIQPSYLAGTEGLLAGEKLHLDVRRMELAYLDLNRREYELTEHVSLLQVAPRALMALRATGTCTFTVPEELFDLKTPGHYCRRISRRVALSIPCVTGPYTGVACTLRLLRSRVRIKPNLLEGQYPAQDDDKRFDDQLGATDAVVTSAGSNDSGLFGEASMRDERLLPFEYRGAISQWQLQLSDLPLFDRDTITDVILHISYTAREGGELLRTKASAHLRELVAAGQAAGSTRLLSVRQEFPTQWAKFTAPAGNGAPASPRALTLDLRPEHYPFFAGASGPSALTRVDLVAELLGADQPDVNVKVVSSDGNGDGQTVPLNNRELGGLLRAGGFGDEQPPDEQPPEDGEIVALPAPTGPFTLQPDTTKLADLFVLLTWKAGKG